MPKNNLFTFKRSKKDIMWQILCKGGLIVLILNLVSDGCSYALPISFLSMPSRTINLNKANLDIKGNLRLRYEYENNFNIKNYQNTKDNYLLERFRWDFVLKTKQGFRAFIQFQDAHCIDCALGASDFKGSCPYINEFDVRQAYVEWQHLRNSPFGLLIGRQSISYGDRRIFGPGDWGNVGRYTWDVAMLKYEVLYLKLDAFYGKRIYYRPRAFWDDHYPYDAYTVYGQIQKLPFRIDFFYVFKNNRKDKEKYSTSFKKEQRHTFGFYLSGEKGDIDYGGTFAYQTGCYPGKRIEAYDLNARLGYTIPILFNSRLAAQYSYASGDKNPHDNKVGTFDGVFGAIDMYYGRMNIFCWKNLEDYQLTYEIMPIKGLKFTTPPRMPRAEARG